MATTPNFGTVDDARELAAIFKRQGHFDRLKEQILSKQQCTRSSTDDAEASELAISGIIRNKVISVVRTMVEEDEELIFKNRGSTSALVEAQLFKDGYQKLSNGDDGFDVEKYIREALKDQRLAAKITETLEKIKKDKEESA